MKLWRLLQSYTSLENILDFCFSSYLVPLIDNVHQQAMEHSQTQRQIHIAVEGGHWGFCVLIGHRLEETPHTIPMLLQEFVHEQHVLLFLSEPESGQKVSYILMKFKSKLR